MKYEGFIKGYPVVYENEYPLWSDNFLPNTYYQVEKCLMVLPPDISREDFLKGMMVLTRGHVNPKIINHVYDETKQRGK